MSAALIRDEAHAAAILVNIREKQYAAARSAFVADDAYATSRLLDAAMRLIAAYQKQREIAGR